MDKIQKLNQIKIFDHVAQKTKEKLIHKGSFQKVPENTFLIRPHEPITAVFFQVTGKSVIYNITHSGKRKILFILGPGELLNEHVLNKYNSSLYCETLDASVVLSVPVMDFIRFMAEDFELTKSILEEQERKILVSEKTSLYGQMQIISSKLFRILTNSLINIFLRMHRAEKSISDILSTVLDLKNIRNGHLKAWN